MISYTGRPEVVTGYKEPVLNKEAHMITEDLFLGAMGSCGSKAHKELVENHVTGIVNCCPKLCVNVYEEEGDFQYCSVAVNDVETADILIWLKPATAFIHHHISSGGKCLVHCQMGVSRSSTVVIAYLMKHHQMSLEEAYVLAKTQRPMVNPNQGFWNQLKTFEQQLTSSGDSDTTSVCQFDDTWMNACYVTFCACHDHDSDIFSSLADCRDLNMVLRKGLDFILGKGLDVPELQFYCALAAAYSKYHLDGERQQQQDQADQCLSSTPAVGHASSLACQEISRILKSDEFIGDWGSDFRECDRIKLLEALAE